MVTTRMRSPAPLFLSSLLSTIALLPACATSGTASLEAPAASETGAASAQPTTEPASTAQPVSSAQVVSTAQPALSVQPATSAQPAVPPSDERLADLLPGAVALDVEKKLGRPASKSQPVLEHATGEFASSWSWPSGESAIMTATKPNALPTLRLLMVTSPSKHKTSRGIGIGSSRKEIEAAYGAAINKELSNAEFVLVGPEMYDGLKLRLDAKGKVTSIALGSDGE